MNKKQTIRLNESQLRCIVKEAVNKVLREFEEHTSKPNTVKNYLDNLPKGSIITNLKVLSLMRRKGLIYYYDKPNGYLGGITPSIIGEKGGRYSSATRYIFPKGNAPKIDDDTPEYETSEEMWNDLGNQSEFEFLGNTFSIKRLSGCAQPYLQKISGSDNNEVNPTMSLYGSLI